MTELYNDGTLRVYTNGSGEIFVQERQYNNATIRISPARRGMSITCHDGELVPSSINGLPAILAMPRPNER